MLSENQVLLVCGETGCGKSTQLGQFILENAIEQQNGANCRIICTQPRRISAVALAERVANERCEKVGGMVGYSIKGVSVQSDDTRLLFCTTGVMLRMVQSDPELDHVSHIIIDEVHERGSSLTN
jgi:HrpA-like RNA helicase